LHLTAVLELSPAAVRSRFWKARDEWDYAAADLVSGTLIGVRVDERFAVLVNQDEMSHRAEVRLKGGRLAAGVGDFSHQAEGFSGDGAVLWRCQDDAQRPGWLFECSLSRRCLGDVVFRRRLAGDFEPCE